MLTAESRALVSEITAGKAKSNSKWHALSASWLGEAFDAMDASLYFIVLYPAISELLRSRNDVAIGQIGSVVLAIFMFGWFLGAIGFGALADKIGRRKTMMITILVYSIATGLCALSHSWQELALYRFVVGCGIGGEICLGTVVIAEFWKGRSRLWATCALESSFNIGLMMSAGFNAAIGSYGWRWLFIAGVIPAILTLYIRSKLKESESFKQMDSSRKSLKAIPRNELTDTHKALLMSPWKQLMQPELRGKLIVTATLGTSAVIGYWACVAWIPAWINQLTGSLAISERSMATTVFSIGGLIGCFATPFLLDRMGRANVMKVAFGGGLLATMAMFLTVKEYGAALMVWSFAVGILTNMQFAALQIYIPEAFPTNVLASAAGICFGAGRIFAVALALCGAQLIGFYDGSYALASATLSLVYVVGFVAAFHLYETNGQVAGVWLPDEEPESSSIQGMPMREPA